MGMLAQHPDSVMPYRHCTRQPWAPTQAEHKPSGPQQSSAIFALAGWQSVRQACRQRLPMLSAQPMWQMARIPLDYTKFPS